MDKIAKCNFYNLDEIKAAKCRPAILVFGDVFWRLSSWKGLLELFYHNACREDENYFLRMNNKYIYVREWGLEPVRKLDPDDRHSVFVGNPMYKHYDYVKFWDSEYVLCYGNIRDETSVKSNLKVMGGVIKELGLNGVSVYLTWSDPEEITEEADAIAEELKKSGLIERSASGAISRIDSEILTPQDEFFKRISREFGKKTLIGDIEISDSEVDKYILPYMCRCLDRLHDERDLKGSAEKAFSIGLVRYAIKYYNGEGAGSFWNHFETWCRKRVPREDYKLIRGKFRAIMMRHHKAYDDEIPRMIDNICMHCFVTDLCADGFFDYLFDFWRTDLRRDAENMFEKDEDGDEYLEALLDEIVERGNSRKTDNIMKHTSLAVMHDRNGCSEKLRHLISVIDYCFWEQAEVPSGGGRLDVLLSDWMKDPYGKFREELKTKTTTPHMSGKVMLHSPELWCEYSAGSFCLRFPQEKVRERDLLEDPFWRICLNGSDFLPQKNLRLYGMSPHMYTEACEEPLPKDALFGKIVMKFVASGMERTYSFPESDVRFFDARGKWTDHSGGYLSVGEYFAYSSRPDMPEILYKDNYDVVNSDGVYVRRYAAERGDMIMLPGGRAVSVGERIKEGLTCHLPMEGIYAIVDGGRTDVYDRLPQLLVKASRRGIHGTYMKINGGEKFIRLDVDRCREFRLDDSEADAYGYLIDLNDYIDGEGYYDVYVDVPGSRSLRDYRFMYLPGMRFEFIDAPYIFKDVGRIAFPRRLDMTCEGEGWETTEDEKILSFGFGTAFENTAGQDGGGDRRELNVRYGRGKDAVDLSIRIPALFWKYDKTAAWGAVKPADLYARDLPPLLYVSGPFDFGDKDNRINVAREEGVERFPAETSIYASKELETDFYSYGLYRAMSWADGSSPELYIYLTLGGKVHEFAKIVISSTVEDVTLSYDAAERVLRGSARIKGEGRYTVSISLDGVVLDEDVPVRGGRFEIRADSGTHSGTYAMTFYEVVEDEYGFGDGTVQIGCFKRRISDERDMSRCRIEIKRFEFCDKKYMPLELSKKYFINSLTRVDVDINEVSLWRPMSEYDHAVCYDGVLSHEGKEDYHVLVVFRDIANDPNEVTVLRRFGGEYVEMLYDRETHLLPKNDESMKLSVWEKKDRIRTLDDDMYDCVVSIHNE